MKKALLYARVSSTEQGQYTLPDQKERMIKYCEIKGIEVAGIYTEKASAKSFKKRPVFAELVRFAKKNRKSIDGILVVRWCRYSRNLSEALIKISEMRDHGIEINSVEGTIDFSVEENLLLLSFYLASPEIDNIKRSKNVKKAMYQARKMGHWCAIAPIGYRNSRTEDNKPIVIPDNRLGKDGRTKAELMQALWADFSTGEYKIQEVRLKYQRLGLIMGKSRIGDVLRSQFYMGKIVLDGFGNDEGGIFQGEHEPLINDETFYKVQSLLGEKAPVRHREYSKVNDNLPLRGLIKGKRCESLLTGSGSRNRHGNIYYYYHTQPTKSGSKERIRADKLEAQILEELRAIKPSEGVLRLYQEILFSQMNKGKRLTQQRRNVNKGKIADVQAKLDKLEERFIFEGLDSATYNKWKTKLMAEINDLKAIESDNEIVTKETIANVGNCTNLLTNLDTYFETGTPSFKKELLDSILTDKIEVFDKKLYRTPIHDEIRGLQAIGAQKKSDCSDSSCNSSMAVPRGIEPLFPG